MQKRLASVSVLMGIMLLGLAAVSQASKCQYPFASEIVSSTPVVDQSADDVLGAPDGVAADFDNRGRTPSTVVVAFKSHIVNREGNDFSITYEDLTERQRKESSEVLVKGPGYNFTRIGVIEPTPGLTERRVSQTAFFNLDVLGWASVSQVMVRNFEARNNDKHEGLDIDGFTAIYCEDDGSLPDDKIVLKVQGLRDAKATCWNTSNNDIVPANPERDGVFSCGHLFADRHDYITLTVVGNSNVHQ